MEDVICVRNCQRYLKYYDYNLLTAVLSIRPKVSVLHIYKIYTYIVYNKLYMYEIKLFLFIFYVYFF